MAGEDDLYTVSVIFYVFRTYGYNISSGKDFLAMFTIIYPFQHMQLCSQQYEVGYLENISIWCTTKIYQLTETTQSGEKDSTRMTTS